MIHEVQVQFTQDDKTVKENVLTEGFDLFAEVEAKLIEEYSGYEDVDVTAIKRSKIKEIANARTADDDVIFTATLVDVFLNDDGSEKEIKYDLAFFSKNMDTAHAYIKEYVSQGYNLGITKISETKFAGVLK